MTDDVILPDDPRAAHQVYLVPIGEIFSWETVPRAWKSRVGVVFGDERTARWAGATHIRCHECDEIYQKSSFCQHCAGKRAEDRYMALPTRDWGDGEMICDGKETFISSFDEMADIIHGNLKEIVHGRCPKVTGKRWVFAEHKTYDDVRLIDIEDLLSGCVYEGFEFQVDTYAAADKLEELVTRDLSSGVWWGSKTRVTFDTFRAWLAEQEEANADL